MYLGDKKFVGRMRKQIKVQGDELNIHRQRNVAIMAAYAACTYSSETPSTVVAINHH